MKQKLDETQQKAVTYGEGPLLVTAGPGSGKTTVITHHIKYLIDNQGISPKEILVITFTKSAAVEMKERFLHLSNQQDTEVVFGTFHAVFYQILRQSGGFGADSILKEKDKYILLRDILKGQKINFYENTFLEDLLGEISQVQNKGNIENYEPVLLEKDKFRQVYNEYERRKDSLGKIDFDDMVVRCYQLLCSEDEVLKKWQNIFRYILVDEFQDINPLQYEIVKLLAEPHHNLFVVGDEDQSIYSFRGADPKSSFRFLEDYPEAEQMFLSINYRCHRDIVEASKRLISHNKDRFDKDISAAECTNKMKINTTNSIEYRTKDAEPNEKENKNAVNIRQYLSEQEEYEEIAKQLCKIKEERGLNRCAILFRTNMISPLFFQELKKKNIPYHMKLKCKEIRGNPVVNDILAYISLAMGDLQRKHFYRIMNKPVRYISRDMVSENTMTWDILKKNTKGYFSVYESVCKLQQDVEYIRKLPVFAAFRYICRGIGYEDWLKTQGGKTMQEGMEMLELLRTLALECDTLEEFVGLCNTIEEMPKYSNGDAVEIMTYHGAKGLEWPVVILPDVMEGITPYKRAKTREEAEEERRMFYVALTRAKEQVYLYSLYSDEKHKKSPSVFIKEVKGE